MCVFCKLNISPLPETHKKFKWVICLLLLRPMDLEPLEGVRALYLFVQLTHCLPSLSFLERHYYYGNMSSQTLFSCDLMINFYVHCDNIMLIIKQYNFFPHCEQLCSTRQCTVSCVSHSTVLISQTNVCAK
jgi:hypothetical protein